MNFSVRVQSLKQVTKDFPACFVSELNLLRDLLSLQFEDGNLPSVEWRRKSNLCKRREGESEEEEEEEEEEEDSQVNKRVNIQLKFINQRRPTISDLSPESASFSLMSKVNYQSTRN